MCTGGSLFSGIGGLDLSFSRAGFDIRWQVEIEPFCRAILKKHSAMYWPNAVQHEDVKNVGKHNLESVDVIFGGFPCQPSSLAGYRKGQHDERWLWPEFYRVIREVKPKCVFIENVPGLLSANNGTAFGGILRALARIGFDAEWDSIRAADFGAPHPRKRVYIVAYPKSQRWTRILRFDIQERIKPDSRWETSGSLDTRGHLINALEERLGQPAIFRDDDGLPPWMVRSVTVPILEAYGNGVVPQVVQPIAENIYQALQQ